MRILDAKVIESPSVQLLPMIIIYHLSYKVCLIPMHEVEEKEERRQVHLWGCLKGPHSGGELERSVWKSWKACPWMSQLSEQMESNSVR